LLLLPPLLLPLLLLPLLLPLLLGHSPGEVSVHIITVPLTRVTLRCHVRITQCCKLQCGQAPEPRPVAPTQACRVKPRRQVGGSVQAWQWPCHAGVVQCEGLQGHSQPAAAAAAA
jgi:hypothetical protein